MLCDLLSVRRQDVVVGIHRKSDAAVSQQFRNHLLVNAFAYQVSGCRVAEIMGAHVRLQQADNEAFSPSGRIALQASRPLPSRVKSTGTPPDP